MESVAASTYRVCVIQWAVGQGIALDDVANKSRRWKICQTSRCQLEESNCDVGLKPSPTSQPECLVRGTDRYAEICKDK